MSFVFEGHQQPPPPCQCQQQFGGAVPWLVVTLAIIFVIDRWNGRRRNNSQKERTGTGDGGPTDGDNR